MRDYSVIFSATPRMEILMYPPLPRLDSTMNRLSDENRVLITYVTCDGAHSKDQPHPYAVKVIHQKTAFPTFLI